MRYTIYAIIDCEIMLVSKDLNLTYSFPNRRGTKKGGSLWCLTPLSVIEHFITEILGIQFIIQNIHILYFMLKKYHKLVPLFPHFHFVSVTHETSSCGFVYEKMFRYSEQFNNFKLYIIQR
jgi:hypothetical protein